MERLDPAHTGIHTEMSDVLTRVDPRLAHIAKWVLSVGDAVAVGDFDGDGTLDLFLTNMLKRPEDRGALYRGLGDLRFERVPLPALERVLQGFPDTGLPSAAEFADFDNDGDQDLAVGFGFGRTRLFKNLRVETRPRGFADVTAAAGIDEHTISLSLVFFDFDRDGKLDLLVTNAHRAIPARTTRGPRRSTSSACPPAEYAGDRRMLRFMHDGWHNADNGGRNVLLPRPWAAARFEKLDAKAMRACPRRTGPLASGRRATSTATAGPTSTSPTTSGPTTCT